MGDVFEVKYLGIDPKTRKEKVSKKALLPRPPRDENAPREDRGPRPERRDDRGPRRDDRPRDGRDNRDSRSREPQKQWPSDVAKNESAEEPKSEE
jgi:polyribonucleotide nucleotidyltransferase